MTNKEIKEYLTKKIFDLTGDCASVDVKSLSDYLEGQIIAYKMVLALLEQQEIEIENKKIDKRVEQILGKRNEMN